MKIEPKVDKRGRWRFTIRDDDGNYVIPIPVRGYGSKDEAMDAANGLLDHRMKVATEAYAEKMEGDRDTIKALRGKVNALAGEISGNLSDIAKAKKRMACWRALAVIASIACGAAVALGNF